jgi:hypothetical protein
MDTRTDNPQSKMEKAEGSRENVNLGQPNPAESGGDADAPMERGAGQVSRPERPIHPTDRDNADGITNRPLSEEEQNQRELPPREERKGE